MVAAMNMANQTFLSVHGSMKSSQTELNNLELNNGYSTGRPAKLATKSLVSNDASASAEKQLQGNLYKKIPRVSIIQ